MESKLQELTNKLYNEGVEKANEEAEKIKSDAKKQADQIKQDAQQQADQIVQQAQQEAEDIKKNMRSEIDMAARQTLRQVQKQITEMIATRVIKEPTEHALEDTEFVKQIITEIIKNWNPQSKEPVDLSITLPEKMQKELQEYLETKAAKELNAGITVEVSDRMKGGFSIGPADGSYKISFSEEDFKNFFKGYLRPRTVKMLFEEADQNKG